MTAISRIILRMGQIIESTAWTAKNCSVGSTRGNLVDSPEPARFSCEGNLPKITIVLQNLPELRENGKRHRKPSRQIHLILRGTCQTSKGQLISKANCQAEDSSKNTNE